MNCEFVKKIKKEAFTVDGHSKMVNQFAVNNN